MEEDTAQPEVIMEPWEPCRSIGDYLLIKCGESTNSMLPACIVRISPLAVCYFTHGPSGLYSASEGDYDILPEDIVKTLEPAQHIKRGSRVYYKFDTMVWLTVHGSVFDGGPCHTLLLIAWFWWSFSSILCKLIWYANCQQWHRCSISLIPCIFIYEYLCKKFYNVDKLVEHIECKMGHHFTDIIFNCFILRHCGLAMPYANLGLDQHWPR